MNRNHFLIEKLKNICPKKNEIRTKNKTTTKRRDDNQFPFFFCSFRRKHQNEGVQVCSFLSCFPILFHWVVFPFSIVFIPYHSCNIFLRIVFYLFYHLKFALFQMRNQVHTQNLSLIRM